MTSSHQIYKTNFRAAHKVQDTVVVRHSSVDTLQQCRKRNVCPTKRELHHKSLNVAVSSVRFRAINLRTVRCVLTSFHWGRERALLDVQMDPIGPEKRQTLRCLNDAVFSRGEISRLIRLAVRVNGEALTEFNADGLIIATPTGSTAYSLSAGGPILAPESGSLVITPICPHTLTNRSIIVADSAVVEIEATERDYPVYLTVDGRKPVHIESGSTVTVRKAAKSLPLAALPGVSFFSVVRQKLKWRGSNV